MKPHVIHSLSSEIAFGLHELLRTNAANIHKSDDWFTLFSLLEVVGAAAHPPPVLQPTTQTSPNDKHIPPIRSTINAESDSECSDCATSTTDKGYTSDTEIYPRSDYIVVSHDDLETMRTQQSMLNQYKIDLNEKLSQHDRRALIKSCETLSFLIRDAAHVTQENFEYCIHCIRTFIEATVTQQAYQQKTKTTTTINTKTLKQIRKATSSNSLNNENINEQNINQSGQTQYITKQSKNDCDDEDDLESIKQEYQSLALQLLDLMHTLHTRASQIYKYTITDQTTSSILWYKCWCPILQG
jgi:brefeldin A-resistance guanine nucleotide exchange factor 1